MMYRCCTVLLVLLVWTTLAHSQTGFTKEENRQLQEADFYFEESNFLKALPIYQAVYPAHMDDADLNYRIGVCSFYLKNHKKEALTYLLKAGERAHTESYFYLGRALHLQRRFPEAINFYLKYKHAQGKKEFDATEVDHYLEKSHYAKELRSNPKEYKIYNIGANVNSEYPDYSPNISADESILVFTSRRKESTGGKLDPNGEYFEDVYISERQGNHWGVAKNMGPAINTETHDACVGSRPDGNQLIIYRTNKEQTGGDLYWSDLLGAEWKEPQKFGPSINSDWQEASATYSNDGTAIYFSSNRPDGYGGKDIYRVVQFGNGDWSEPLNLGPTINGPYDEDAPFLHPDSRTLYFSSKGRQSMGGFDVFRSTLDEEGEWTEAENLGYPLNSVFDDTYFVLSANGKTGYYSSGAGNRYGDQDIYWVDMPGEETALSIVKGIAMDDSTRQPLQAVITLINVANGDIEGSYLSNSSTGKFLLILSPNHDYKIVIEAEGYHPFTESLIYAWREGFNEVAKKFRLSKSEK